MIGDFLFLESLKNLTMALIQEVINLIQDDMERNNIKFTEADDHIAFEEYIISASDHLTGWFKFTRAQYMLYALATIDQYHETVYGTKYEHDYQEESIKREFIYVVGMNNMEKWCPL